MKHDTFYNVNQHFETQSITTCNCVINPLLKIFLMTADAIIAVYYGWFKLTTVFKIEDAIRSLAFYGFSALSSCTPLVDIIVVYGQIASKH